MSQTDPLPEVRLNARLSERAHVETWCRDQGHVGGEPIEVFGVEDVVKQVRALRVRDGRGARPAGVRLADGMSRVVEMLDETHVLSAEITDKPIVGSMTSTRRWGGAPALSRRQDFQGARGTAAGRYSYPVQ